MKKYLWLLCAVGIPLGSLGAKAGTNSEVMPKNNLPKHNVTIPAVDIKSLPYRPRTGEAVQGKAEYRVIDSLFNAFSFYGSNAQPYVYDPDTKLLICVKRGANPPSASQNNSDMVNLITSSDLGKTWSKSKTLVIGDNSQGKPRYPSVAVMNSKNHSNNPDDLQIVYAAPINRTSGWDGVFCGILINKAGETPQTLPVYGTTINGKEYSFGSNFTIVAQYKSDLEVYSNMPVPLSPKDTNDTEITSADVSGIGSVFADYNASDNYFTVKTPDEWRSALFRDPSSKSGSHRALIGLREDAAGKLYNCIYARFADDSNFLTFAVSTSSDNGKTWSEYNRMPKSVLDAFAQTQGVDADSIFFSFRDGANDGGSAQDFVVYGPDKWSCVGTLLSTIPGKSQTVECNFDNGTWSVRQITPIILFENLALNDSGQGFWKFETIDQGNSKIDASQLGHETQICRTADGTKLLAKTIEVFNTIIGKDTVTTTDVVVSVRDVTSNKWDRLRNATNSDITDRVTWLPNVLPNDLKDIPLLTVQAAAKGETDRETLIEIQRRLATDDESQADAYRQYVTISNFTYSDLPEFEGLVNALVSVTPEENITIGLSPNPASGSVTVHYDVTGASTVAIDVLNAVGQKVLSVTPGAESNYYTFNTENLAAGAYYCTVRANGTTVTRMFTVVH